MNILQIAGGEGSGRTALAIRLAEEWSVGATILPLDRYLRNKHADDGPDFVALPASIDWPLIKAHIEALARGDAIRIPQYDLATGHRLPFPIRETAQFDQPRTDVLIIDGRYYAQDVESIRLFVDAPTDTRRERVNQMEGESASYIAALFDALYEPAYWRDTLPLRDEADLVLDGCQPLDELLDQAQRYVASVWGAWG
ncbi:MAG: hypothetical protein IT324_06160 [Anaerolineae bacterium]|nr:hypothetical protein [Anaerolineae bacterium]